MWLNTLAGKQALYHSMSEYHRSEHDNNEKKNIGEALSRLAVISPVFPMVSHQMRYHLQIPNLLYLNYYSGIRDVH